MTVALVQDVVEPNSKKSFQNSFDFHATLTKLDVPVNNKWIVYLYEKASGLLFGRSYTDPQGNFTFKNVNKAKDYFIIAFDKERIYNSITYDLVYEDVGKFTLLPSIANPSLIGEKEENTISLVRQIVNAPYLLSSMSCCRGYTDDTGFSWTSTDTNSINYQYFEDMHCFYFKNTNYIHNRTNSFNNEGEPSTVEFWVRPFASSSDRAVVGSRISDGAGHQYIGLTGNTNKVFLNRPANIFTGAEALTFQSNTAIPNDKFTHIAVVFTGDSFRIYINGTLDAIKEDTQGLPFNINGIELGYSAFTGYIGGFKLFNSVLYSDNFTPSKEPILINSIYEDPNDIYAENVLLKLGFPNFFKSYMARDLAKNAFLTKSVSSIDANSVTTSGLFETINQSTNLTLRQKQFTFECVIKTLAVNKDSNCLFSNANITNNSVGLGQWGFFAGTAENPGKYVFKTFVKEYSLDYNFILNETVIIKMVKDFDSVSFYINNILVGTFEVLESIGNSKDRFCFSSGASLQIFDFRLTNVCRDIEDVLDTSSIPDQYYKALSYSYQLNPDISDLGFGFTKENPLTTSEEYYSPDHSLYLDGKPLISKEFTGDSVIDYEYSFAILPTEVSEENILFSTDKEDEYLAVSLTSDFKIKLKTVNAEVVSDTALATDSFNIITVTFDKSVFKVYLDGIFQLEVNKGFAETRGASLVIGQGIKGYLDDLTLYRNRIVHKTNFNKLEPLSSEIFSIISDIQITPTTKYFLDFSRHISGQNAFPDSKLNANWTIYHSWIYPTADKWLRYNYNGGVYYSDHSFYHNKNSYFSLSTRIRHIVGPHHANGWTVLYYHNYNFIAYLNRVTGGILVEFNNSGTYLGGVTVGYMPNFLSYEEYDITFTFKDAKVWVHLNKELMGVAQLPSNWTNTYSHWFGVGTPGSGNYPIGYYDLKYFRYDLNHTDFLEINMEYLADKLAFKLNLSSDVNITGKSSTQMLFDSSYQRTEWTSNGSALASSLIPFDNTTSVSFNGLNQYLSSGENIKCNIGKLPFTFKFKLHLNTDKVHCILGTDGNSTILITEDGSLKIVTVDGVEYTSDYKLTSLKPYSISITRKKSSINLYVDGYLRDILLINIEDQFNFNENGKTYIGSDLTNYLNGNLTYLAFYIGSSLTPVKPAKELPIFNYLSNVEFTKDGLKDTNVKNVWTKTGTPITDISLKQFKKYSKTFSASYYSIPTSSDWAIGTSNFTIESTFRLTTMPTSSYGSVYGNWISNTGFCLFIRPGGILDFRINDTNPIATASSCIKLNQWVTITIVREGNTISAYYNGALIASGSSSASLTSINGPCIGRNNVATDFFYGQIESFKFIKKAIHPVPSDIIATKPFLEEAEFNVVTKNTLRSTEENLADQFYVDKESLYNSGYIESNNDTIKLYANTDRGVKYYFKKTLANFETLELKAKLSQNIFGISLQDNTEIQFTSEGVFIIHGQSKENISVITDSNSLSSIKIKREVNWCSIYLNEDLLYNNELFSELGDYEQYLYFNSVSNLLTSIELKEVIIASTYNSSVYLYSPLKKDSREFVAKNVQEISSPMFINNSLQVQQKVLQLNLKEKDVQESFNTTLRFNISLSKYGQDLLITDQYTFRVNAQGSFEVYSDSKIILVSPLTTPLDTSTEISLEKYNSTFRLFINSTLVGTSEQLEENLNVTYFIIGNTGSNFSINSLIYLNGAAYYEDLLNNSKEVNDYNFKKLEKTVQTSALLSFEESAIKDETNRQWTLVGSSPRIVKDKSPLDKALYMNGIDDYIMTNAGAISGGATPFSLEMLICPDETQPPNGGSAGGSSQTAGGSLFAQNYNTGSGEQHLYWGKGNERISYSIGSVRGGGELSSLSTTNTAPKRHWTKVILSYDGKTMRLFLNGRLEKSVSYPTGWMNNGSRIRLGHCLVEGYSDYRMSYGGYFDEVRITDGKCDYFKSHDRQDANLISYLSFDDITSSTSVFDNKGNIWSASNIVYNTSVKPSTSYSSAWFNGNTKATLSDSSIFNFGKEKFAVKIKFYPTDPGNYLVLFANHSPDTANLLSITIASSNGTIANKAYFYYYSQNIVSNKPVVYNAWNEVIVERNGNVLRISLNGDVNTTAISAEQNFNYSYNGGTSVGIPVYTTNSNFKGYVDSLAVYKGTTLIPTARTPVLNLPLEYNVFDVDNFDTDWTFKDIEFRTINGKPACYFNGVSSTLESTNAKVNLGTEDFIIKFECCPASFNNLYSRIIATNRGSETKSKQYIMLTGASYSMPENKQSFYFGQEDGDQYIFSTGFTAQANTWYSVEIVRKAGVVTYYINGSKYTSATVNKAINFIENGKVIIGAASDTTGANGSNPSQYFHGYLSNFKIYKGINSLD